MHLTPLAVKRVHLTIINGLWMANMQQVAAPDAGEDAKRKQLCTHCWGKPECYSNTVWQSLKKSQHALNIQFHYCSLGHLSQSNENLCSHKARVWTFMEALVTIAQNWRKPRCPSTGGWLNKLWQSTPGMLCNSKNEWYRHKLGSIWRELCWVKNRDFKTYIVWLR